MIIEEKKKTYLWRVNNSVCVAADNAGDAETVFHKHYISEVDELRKTDTLYL